MSPYDRVEQTLDFGQVIIVVAVDDHETVIGVGGGIPVERVGRQVVVANRVGECVGRQHLVGATAAGGHRGLVGSDGGDARPVAGSDDVLDRRVENAFDHRRIIIDALEAMRAELEHTTLATSFWADEFRISGLRRVYELVWGTHLEPGNFRRKVRKNADWTRPAELFRSERNRVGSN